MTAGARVAVAALVAGAALLRVQAQTVPPSQPTQTFRTGTDMVIVDVSVRDGGRAVTGLRAEDFVVTDNGVRQRVESVEAAAVPIDVTLVVDLSGSPRGSWSARVLLSRTAAQIQAELERVTAMLRPDDRVRLLAMDNHVQQLLPMRAAEEHRSTLKNQKNAFGRLEADGKASLFDALAAAMLQPVEPSRRHVVIARTKGLDTISSVDANAVRAIAERSDALLHVVLMETALDNDEALRAFQCQLMGLCWPTRRFWVPFQRRLMGSDSPPRLLPDGQEITAAADATGGALHRALVFTEPTLTGIFKKTFEDFRSSYVLRYSPPGVPQPGWHAIDVKVPGSGSYTVRARKGYLVEEDVPAPTPVTVPEVPRTLADFTAAYEHRAYRQLVGGLRTVTDPARLLRDFAEAGNPWPAAPRREAAFALELAEAAVFSSNAATRRAGHETLERFTRLIRNPLEPDAFERYWHFAALTLMEGTIRPAVTEQFVARALERFPHEPRFLLSRAIAIDQKWAARGDGTAFNAAALPPVEHVAAVRDAYAAAAAHSETEAEAHIRLAWFLHRTGRHDEALALLTGAGAQPNVDPATRYLRQLFLGHVLWALDQHEEAVEGYRAALAVSPAAQSARVALMNALHMRGDRDAAEVVAEQIQAETRIEPDPWWAYWQGQYRIHPHAMARIREMSQ